jgi:hypothetical protein
MIGLGVETSNSLSIFKMKFLMFMTGDMWVLKTKLI